MIIWIHLITAVLALILGGLNLLMVKGTPRHRIVGWCWIVAMLCVTLPSFMIREINDGNFSWIHGLTVWTLISMAAAIVSVRRGWIQTHARFMVGTMAGAVLAGSFALAPGRFIGNLVGY